ncbi:MAG: hypothetical protein OXF02_02850 [Simkaniaceae bacterium]|nr:hypothetical protein [Simkaniaceae bacterium]
MKRGSVLYRVTIARSVAMFLGCAASLPAFTVPEVKHYEKGVRSPLITHPTRRPPPRFPFLPSSLPDLPLSPPSRTERPAVPHPVCSPPLRQAVPPETHLPLRTHTRWYPLSLPTRHVPLPTLRIGRTTPEIAVRRTGETEKRHALRPPSFSPLHPPLPVVAPILPSERERTRTTTRPPVTGPVRQEVRKIPRFRYAVPDRFTPPDIPHITPPVPEPASPVARLSATPPDIRRSGTVLKGMPPLLLPPLPPLFAPSHGTKRFSHRPSPPLLPFRQPTPPYGERESALPAYVRGMCETVTVTLPHPPLPVTPETKREERPITSPLAYDAGEIIREGYRKASARALYRRHGYRQALLLSAIPDPESLQTLSLDQGTTVKVSCLPDPVEGRYRFALTVHPDKRLYFISRNRHFIFVIDGSRGIRKHRYDTFKNGVVKSLPYMHEGDSCTVLTAHKRIEPVSPAPLTYGKGLKERVRHHLSRENRGKIFIRHDLFRLLDEAMRCFDPNKDNNIILITNGETLETIKTHREALTLLAEKNRNRFALFTACAGGGNNIAMLNLISTLHNGESMYSRTHAAFPRQLAIFVKHIGSCIAKTVRARAVSANETLNIEFYPEDGAFPPLYADRPYTLYGSINRLEDFDLILQGRIGDQWVNMRQKISFNNAEQGDFGMQKHHATYEAYAYYDRYLQSDDPSFLQEAEKILLPYVASTATRR